MLENLLLRISSNYEVMQRSNTSFNHLKNRMTYDKSLPELKFVFHVSHKSVSNASINHVPEARGFVQAISTMGKELNCISLSEYKLTLHKCKLSTQTSLMEDTKLFLRTPYFFFQNERKKAFGTFSYFGRYIFHKIC